MKKESKESWILFIGVILMITAFMYPIYAYRLSINKARIEEAVRGGIKEYKKKIMAREEAFIKAGDKFLSRIVELESEKKISDARLQREFDLKLVEKETQLEKKQKIINAQDQEREILWQIILRKSEKKSIRQRKPGNRLNWRCR